MDACTVVFSVARIAHGPSPHRCHRLQCLRFTGILCTLAKMYDDNIRHFHRISRTIEKRPYDYEPFGNAISGVRADQRLSYIDKEKDKESGLGDFGVRKYDDGLGRFMSVDPLWESYRGMTPYHYSRNNPLVLSDPSGMADYLDPDGKKLGSDGEDNNDIYYTTGDIYKKHTTDKGTDWAAIRATEGTELRPPQEAVQGVYDNVYTKITSTTEENNKREHGGAIGEDRKFYPGPSGPPVDLTNGNGTAEFDSNPAILGMVKKFGVYPAWTVHSHLQSTWGIKLPAVLRIMITEYRQDGKHKYQLYIMLLLLTRTTADG